MITFKIILNATHPIKFQKSLRPLLNTLLYEDGLTFTNTRTGEHVPRPTMYGQYILSNCNGLPTEEHKAQWVTLYPDQPYTLEATVKPMLPTSPILPTLSMTPAEMKEGQSQRTPVTKGRHLRRFEDGQTFEIGVKEEVRVKKWV